MLTFYVKLEEKSERFLETWKVTISIDWQLAVWLKTQKKKQEGHQY